MCAFYLEHGLVIILWKCGHWLPVRLYKYRRLFLWGKVESSELKARTASADVGKVLDYKCLLPIQRARVFCVPS